MQDARNCLLQATNSSQDLQKPIEDAVLEFTRKDGTVTTTSLGDRMHAYRKMVNREQKRLDELFTQRADVEKSIDYLFAGILGPNDSQVFFKDPKAVAPMPDQVAQERLLEELEAEKQRVKDASEALGKKAIKAMEAGEKVRHVMSIFGQVYGSDINDAVRNWGLSTSSKCRNSGSSFARAWMPRTMIS